jgi:hypothetical protein
MQKIQHLRCTLRDAQSIFRKAPDLLPVNLGLTIRIQLEQTGYYSRSEDGDFPRSAGGVLHI